MKNSPIPRLVEPYSSSYVWATPNPNHRMCDYGAKKFREGVCDCVTFEVMPWEVAEVKEYMATHHPDVFYVFGSGERTLAKAIQCWRENK